ncbi:MAG: flagellar motor switch protein FliM [Armatimonadetes bacterium]|nr:flagellar motor switch protein FliM [Armatimonadota bacterium]
MDGMLSQEEVDRLLAQTAQAGALPYAAGLGGFLRDVALYDFKRPEKFSREQLRSLERIHERFARLLSTTLSAYIRTNIIIRIESVTPLSYHDFVFALPQPTLIHVVQLAPLDGQVALEMNPTVVFPMFEQMMGGKQRGNTRIRPLTDVELVLFQRPFERVMQCLAETWQDFIVLRPRLIRAEQDPQFAQVAAVNTPVVVVGLEVTIGEEFGMMSLCMPDVVVDELLRYLGQDRGISQKKGPADVDEDRVRRAMQPVHLPVVARLGRSLLTVGQVRDLGLDDVVRLDTRVGHDITVQVGDHPAFRGRVGQLRRKLAVRVTAVEDPPPRPEAFTPKAPVEPEADA